MDIGDKPRGEDFAAKFARGEWAETVLIETIERDDQLLAFQYGISRGDALESKEELDRVKEPNVEEMKRPDILVYNQSNFKTLNQETQELVEDYIAAGPDERTILLPKLEDAGVQSGATMALEAESSKFRVDKREYNSSLSAYVKDEDYPRLQKWRNNNKVPIYICQLFFDEAYIIPFSSYEENAESARKGSCSISGFEHGTIPGIWKPGLKAKVNHFPEAEFLGRFKEYPSVVKQTIDDTTSCDYRWENSGKLKAEDDTAIFSGGTLVFDQHITDFL